MNTIAKLPGDVVVGEVVLLDHKTTMTVSAISVSGVAGSTVTLHGVTNTGKSARLISGRCIRVSVKL